eukprot:scaffold6699_cov33-Phaeocystis_antarctica.AAC.1
MAGGSAPPAAAAAAGAAAGAAGAAGASALGGAGSSPSSSGFRGDDTWVEEVFRQRLVGTGWSLG